MTWGHYSPPGSPEYYSPTEAECQEGCTVMAQKYGPGCCQYGVAQTKNQPPSCLYSTLGAEEVSYSGFNWWQEIHKISICTTSAEFEEESAIGHETIANVGASGSDIRPMLVNVFAAFGLC